MSDCGCKKTVTTSVVPNTSCSGSTEVQILASGNTSGVVGSCCDKNICAKPKCAPKPGCSTNHLPTIKSYEFSPIVKSTSQAIMPDVDLTNVLQFGNSNNIPVGAYLFSNDIGYIEIMSWDNINKLATFRNSSVFDGFQVIQVGEWIPDCTEWTVGIPFIGAGTTPTSDACYLANDLTVPPVGSNVFTSFTSTDCFSNGQFIRIDGVPLKVIDVISSTQAELQNVDASTDALRQITAKDCDRLLHKVILIGEVSECENEVESLAGILGATNVDTCEKGILVTTLPNQYLGTTETGEWIPKTFPIDIIETPIANCITLNPAADPQEYTVVVQSAANFAVGKVVAFTCDDEGRTFNIKSITGNTLVLVPCFTVDAVEIISDNCDSCNLRLAECCDQCNGGLVTKYGALGITQTLKFGEWFTPVQFYAPNTFPWNIGQPGEQRTIIDADLVNDTCCKQLVVISMFLDVTSFMIRGTVDKEAERDLTWLLELRWNLLINGVPSAELAHFSHVYDSDIDLRDQVSGKRRMFVGNSGAPAESVLSDFSFMPRTGTLSKTVSFELLPGDTATIITQDMLTLSDNFAAFQWGLQSNTAKTSLEIVMNYGFDAPVYTKPF